MDDLVSLLAAVSDADLARRRTAAQGLAQLGEQAQGAAVPLVRLMAEEDEETRQWASSALEDLGPPSREDAVALTALLDHLQADVGYWAATLLGRLGEGGAAAVEPLGRTLLHSPHATVRQRAAWALGQIGPPAQGALAALNQAASSDDPRLARLAQQAAEAIGRK
jgi:HEAT repeat protein